MKLEAFLLDLDGTLADTAPDLVAVLNCLLREEGRSAMPYATARNEVSNGAVGLIRYACGDGLEADELERLRQRFLELYAISICVNTRLFMKLRELSEVCSIIGCRWGIVTNKPAALTEPLLEALGLAGSTPCVISGDTLPERKPHPAPLLHAARMLEAEPAHCIYVGDAARDIEAGQAAAMATVAATYGYIRPAENVHRWGADAVLRHPAELGAVLERMTRT